VMDVPDRRRLLPRTDAVLADARLAEAEQRLGRTRVRRAVTEALDALRADDVPAVPDAAAVATAALNSLPGAATSMRQVINATGVVVHTNLGRAALSDAAADALVRAAGYVDVEYDIASGRRAKRGRAALAALQAAVPDAGAVHVANNGAAALLLAVATLAPGRDVLISRGELIEIGDGFRLPDLVAAAGGRIREVGTTNRTTLDDFAAAVGPETGAVLKVHPSNYRVEGFTRAVEVRDLAGLGVPVVADVGSGLLAPEPALPDEPDVRTALRAGATVVICSGDKLLGGPQAGLVFGAADVVERMRRHPLARAVRVDKLTLAALEATLDGPATPTRRALHAAPDELRRRCERLEHALARAVPSEIVRADGVVGGGGAPGVALPGYALALPEPFAELLRAGDPPVITRVERGRCLVDPRCIAERDEPALLDAIRAAATRQRPG
jgi:L-seryl-tRNA(Ser) seleniumtransferase